MRKIILISVFAFVVNGLTICQDNKLLEGYFKLDKSDTTMILKNNKRLVSKVGAKSPNDQYEVTRTDTFVLKKYNSFDSPTKRKTLDSITINCIDWWISTPVNTQEKLRDEIRGFIKGYSLVSTPINKSIIEKLTNDSENADNIGFSYSCGIKKYLIINTHENDDWKLQNAGLRSVSDFFNTNNQFKKPIIVTDYEKINPGKLEGWIKEKMK
jgi:hypothetical protein